MIQRNPFLRRGDEPFSRIIRAGLKSGFGPNRKRC